MSPTGASPRYSGLDEMRALAVLAVMVQHWSLGLTGVDLGRYGVQVFFTISGFLITGILLRSRAAVRAGAYNLGAALRNFYFRRFLRIFPPYYLILLLGVTLGLPQMRESLWWNCAYLSNVLMGHVLHAWTSSYGGHFWSLSIEEQFYLAWPLLVLSLERRSLQVLCVAILGGAVCFRYFLFRSGAAPITIFVDTLANLDTLALGALGALNERRLLSSRGWAAGLLAAGIVGCVWGNLHRYSLAGTMLFNSFIGCAALAAIALVSTARYPADSPILRPMRNLGRISYGVYLYHPYAAGLVGLVLEMVQLKLFYPLRALLCVATSIGLAALSWRLFESKILLLKDAVTTPSASIPA